MRACICGWLILGTVLAAVGCLTAPYLAKCGEDDVIFAREYAGEMLTILEQISAGAGKCAAADEACGYYLERADELCRRKEAAVHLRGDLAYDFVYAFAAAEEWCRASARACDGCDPAAAVRARAALAQARAEFVAIMTKPYYTREKESR